MKNKRVIMKIKNFLFVLSFVFACSFFCYGQKVSEKNVINPDLSKTTSQIIKSSPAYAELLLRKTEREAELEEFLLDYTDEFPKVKELRFELELLQKQLEKVSSVSASDASKLSLALGKLLVRKTKLEVDFWKLLKQYNADHPEVKRAKRKIEVYEKAVKEILP
jgi:uncharacterized protein involved in exopolysaccharide biosynthesis